MSDREVDDNFNLTRAFSVGDAVNHKTVGNGTVTALTDKGVHVSFENGCLGIYDAAWFRIRPNTLFRR